MLFDIDLQNRNYIIRLSILFGATIIGIMTIWWALIREESFQWVSGQVLHQPNQYAISKMFDGRFEVVNIMRGFTIVSPLGWETEDERTPVFYLVDEGRKICEIRTEWVNAKKTAQTMPTGAFGEKTTIIAANGEIEGWKKEEENRGGAYFRQISLPVDIAIFSLHLSYQSADQEVCLIGLNELLSSFQR